MESSLEAIRSRMEALARQLLAISDDRLADSWGWRGARRTVRFALYRIYELLEEAAANLASGLTSSAGSALRGRVTAARWSLHGSLLSHDSLVDAIPGDDWSLRLVLTHLINAHEFWSWQLGHLLDQIQATGTIPYNGYVREQVPDSVARQPDRRPGSLSYLRRELDHYVDSGLNHLTSLEVAGFLDQPIKFQGASVTLRYFPSRWSAHLSEHRLQVDKTIESLDHRREVAQVVGRILGAYGELESSVLSYQADLTAMATSPELDEIESCVVSLGKETVPDAGPAER